MRVGRNDPCPCGSGRKYKKCCLDLDRQSGASGQEAGRVREIAAGASEWEADVVAMPGGLEGDPASRLAALLVVAEGFVIHSEALNRPSPEPEAMAEILAAGILAAGERIGALPERVTVREPEVAAALARRLAERAAVEAGLLTDLDEAAYALVEHTTGRPSRVYASCPDTWAAWDLPEELVARLFRAAAAFYRAAPWTGMANRDVLEAVMPAGNEWTACVMGNAGEEYGLALYSEADDFWGMTDWDDPESAFDDLAGRIVSLHLDPGRDLHKAMRREVAAAGWEVADPQAYPRLFAVNTPAGGVRLRDAEDLAALLEAILRFVEEHGAAVAKGGAVEDWRDEATGVTLSYGPEEGDDEAWIPGSVEDLEPGCAEGPGADPEAALTEARAAMDDPDAFVERETAVVERFARHLAEEEGLSRTTVAKHADHATTFVEFLAGTGVPVRAVHEYDLRVFLFDWYPRKVVDSASRMAALPGSLRRFFDFLVEVEGIDCPWAWEILADREAIRERWEGAPGGPFWEADVGEWRGEHDDDLVARLLLPDSGLGGGEEVWGSLMGVTEAQLHHELGRRWLLWRDEVLAEGVDGWSELVVRLITRQREWERARHPDLAGKSPLEAILDERKEHGDRSGLLDLLRGGREGKGAPRDR